MQEAAISASAVGPSSLGPPSADDALSDDAFSIEPPSEAGEVDGDTESPQPITTTVHAMAKSRSARIHA